jgi:glycosyltransferase involved in cell wall biosynthesis
MRVLMTADTVGGVWTYAVELSRALDAYGVRIVLATMGGRLNAAQRRDVRELGNLELVESTFRLEWMDEPWRDVDRAGEWLLGIEQDAGADLVHINGFAHAALPWRAPTIVVGHSCVCSWWRAVRGDDAPAAWDEYRRRVARGLSAADHVVAPTHAMLDALVRHYGPPPASTVIPNGRDARLFTPSTKQAIVLTAGRLWDEAKNIAALDRIAPGLPWPVYVAGPAESPSGDAPRHDNGRLLGRLAPRDLARWLGRAGVYALPARYEPFGLSVLEAALAGCALVLGDIASLREIWGDAATFVDPSDDAAILRALLWLCDDPVLRRRTAERARRRALELTPQRMAASYLDLYRELRADGVRTRETSIHAYRHVLPLAPLGLEPRERPFPPRGGERVDRAWP